MQVADQLLGNRPDEKVWNPLIHIEMGRSERMDGGRHLRLSGWRNTICAFVGQAKAITGTWGGPLRALV